MNSKKLKQIKAEIADAMEHYPNYDPKILLKQAIQDYNKTPRKERHKFSIFIQLPKGKYVWDYTPEEILALDKDIPNS